MVCGEEVLPERPGVVVKERVQHGWGMGEATNRSEGRDSYPGQSRDVRRRRRVTNSWANPSHWSDRGPCSAFLPDGSRAGALEQLIESGTGYRCLDWGQSHAGRLH